MFKFFIDPIVAAPEREPAHDRAADENGGAEPLRLACLSGGWFEKDFELIRDRGGDVSHFLQQRHVGRELPEVIPRSAIPCRPSAVPGQGPKCVPMVNLHNDLYSGAASPLTVARFSRTF